MKINFHVLDGMKIGGIENLALTLSNQKVSEEQNYLINLNKNINNYSNYFYKNNKYKDLALKVLEMNSDSKGIYEKSLKAKEYALKNFSIQKMADSYFDYLML